jgi:hypothetical protein
MQPERSPTHGEERPHGGQEEADPEKGSGEARRAEGHGKVRSTQVDGQEEHSQGIGTRRRQEVGCPRRASRHREAIGEEVHRETHTEVRREGREEGVPPWVRRTEERSNHEACAEREEVHERAGS